ncbi:MAG: presqualene diphosphate synthase HpnD, partial [Elusimicrobia bacterium]|nr:presqualene diphosphate synthase HpnD [Elusimicrobiota bacterium]
QAPVRPQKGSSFALGFLFLTKERRQALEAVYEFCRVVDDVVDDGTRSEEEAARELAGWREEVERLYGGAPTRPLTRRLAPFVERFALPKEGFASLVDGVAMDLEKKRYETYEDLRRYLFGVAGTVGLLCVEIFGHESTPPEALRAYAVTMGDAFQLTNIMRDVGGDLERGRLYLPLADLDAARCRVDSVLQREYTPEFAAAMKVQYGRAKESYRRAGSLLDPADRAAQLPGAVMAAVYEDVLEELRRREFRVLFGKVTTSKPRRLLLAAKAWARAHGIY